MRRGLGISARLQTKFDCDTNKVPCIVCGKKFLPKTNEVYCSETCVDAHAKTLSKEFTFTAKDLDAKERQHNVQHRRHVYHIKGHGKYTLCKRFWTTPYKDYVLTPQWYGFNLQEFESKAQLCLACEKASLKRQTG